MTNKFTIDGKTYVITNYKCNTCCDSGNIPTEDGFGYSMCPDCDQSNPYGVTG